MSADFISHFASLPDPRINRRKIYPLLEILFLVIAATVSGCDGWKQIKDFGEVKLEWLRQLAIVEKLAEYRHGHQRAGYR